MQFKASFFHACAVAALLASATTLLLAFLPELHLISNGLDARLSQLGDRGYRWVGWIHLLQPFLGLAAAIGIAVRIRRRNSAAALVSILAFTLWAFTEAALRALSLSILDRWHAMQSLENEAARAAMHAFDGVLGGLIVLVAIGAIVGNTALGIAMARSKGMTRTVGYLLVTVAIVSLLNVLPPMGMPALPTRLALWVYQAIQLAAYAVSGLWLWRYAMDEG